MSDSNLERNLRRLLRAAPPAGRLREGGRERILGRVLSTLRKDRAQPLAAQTQELHPAPNSRRRIWRLTRPLAAAAVALISLCACAWWLTGAQRHETEGALPSRPPAQSDPRPTPSRLVTEEASASATNQTRQPQTREFAPAPEQTLTEQLADGSALEIGGGSRVRVTTWPDRPRPLVELLAGRVGCRVSDGPGRFAVRTPVGEALALGKEFSVRLEEQAEGAARRPAQGDAAMRGPNWLMTVAVLSGLVQVAGPEGFARLAAAGETVTVSQKRPGKEAFQAGQLVPKLLDGSQGEPLEIRRHQVNVTIRDQVTLVEVEEVFYNPSPERLEGTFFFPLPAGATISRLAMYVGDNLMEGEIAEAARARRTFEALKVQRIDPALLEWAGGNNFKMRVFPIEPKSEKRVLISYYQVLEKENDTLRFSYPLASDALQTNPLGKLQLNLACDSQLAIRSCQTPGYSPQLQQEANRIRLTLAAEKIRPERNFELLCTLAPEAAELTVLPFWHASSQEGYFLCIFSPRLEAFNSDPEHEAGRRFLFVVDKSGGLGPRHLALAVKTVETALGKLRPKDHFGIVAYDTFAERFSPALVPATPEAILAASAWLGALEPAGASDLGAAWQAAAPLLGKAEPGQVLYIGSGMSTLTSTQSGRLLRDAEAAWAGTQARISCLPLGPVTDQDFLGELAKRFGGALRPIDSVETMQEQLADLFQDFGTPLYTHLQLDFQGLKVEECYPRELPNLSAGRQLLVFGKYLAQGQARVRLSAQYKDAPYAKEFPIEFGAAAVNTCIPPLWATRRIEHLQREAGFARTEDAQRLVRSIVETSKRYTVMSQHTSFLVLESPEDYLRYGIERRLREFGPYAGQGGVSPAEQLASLAQGGGGGEARKYFDREGAMPAKKAEDLARNGSEFAKQQQAQTSAREGADKLRLGEEPGSDRAEAPPPANARMALKESESLAKPGRTPPQAPASAPSPDAKRASKADDSLEYGRARNKGSEADESTGEALRNRRERSNGAERTAAFRTEVLSWERTEIFPVLEDPPADPLAHWPPQWRRSDPKALEILRQVSARIRDLSCKITNYRLDPNGREIQEGQPWLVTLEPQSGRYLSYREGADSKDLCDGLRLARFFPQLKHAATRAALPRDVLHLAASLPGYLLPWTERTEREGLVSIEQQNTDGVILRITTRGDERSYIRLFLESERGPVTKVEVYRRQNQGGKVYSALTQTILCEEFRDLGGVRLPTLFRTVSLRPGSLAPEDRERLQAQIQKLSEKGEAGQARKLQEQLNASDPVAGPQSIQRLTGIEVNAAPQAGAFAIEIPKDWTVRNVDAKPRPEERKTISTPLNPSLNEWGRN